MKSFSYIEYFPFWEKSIVDIPKMLKNCISKLFEREDYQLEDIDYFAITITAELSDAFQTKKEGIETILDALEKVFEKDKLRFISTQSSFLDYDTVKSNPYSVAAANWVSTALFLGHYVSECILIDAGSTTVDIIPIVDSQPASIGKDDISRLINHELIYTGGLRATIPSITHHVPYKGKKLRISFEKYKIKDNFYHLAYRCKNLSEKACKKQLNRIND